VKFRETQLQPDLLSRTAHVAYSEDRALNSDQEFAVPLQVMILGLPVDITGDTTGAQIEHQARIATRRTLEALIEHLTHD
jgi:hypothetical protein